jgi:hypothetical protein
MAGRSKNDFELGKLYAALFSEIVTYQQLVWMAYSVLK